MKTAAVETSSLTSSLASFLSDFAELVKARLTLLVLLTTAVGFYLGSESPIDYRALVHTVLGTAAAAAGRAYVADTSARARCSSVIFWSCVFGGYLQRPERGADGNHNRDLYLC